MTRPLPPEVEEVLAKNSDLLVRSVFFNAIMQAARSDQVIKTDAELAALLTVGLAEVCRTVDKLQGALTRATMLTTRPIDEILGGIIGCYAPSSPAAEPTASGPDSTAERPT